MGGFTVGLSWAGERLRRAVVRSDGGLACTVAGAGVARATVTDAAGRPVDSEILGPDTLRFATRRGGTYVLAFP